MHDPSPVLLTSSALLGYMSRHPTGECRLLSDAAVLLAWDTRPAPSVCQNSHQHKAALSQVAGLCASHKSQSNKRDRAGRFLRHLTKPDPRSNFPHPFWLKCSSGCTRIFSLTRRRWPKKYRPPTEARAVPAPSSKKPEEREFVVDSGALMHMLSKKDLS